MVTKKAVLRLPKYDKKMYICTKKIYVSMKIRILLTLICCWICTLTTMADTFDWRSANVCHHADSRQRRGAATPCLRPRNDKVNSHFYK